MDHRYAIPKVEKRRHPMETPSDKQDYIREVLDAYRHTPGTTGLIHRNDRILAAKLYDRGVPLIAVQNALVLAAARRIVRSPDAPALQPVRSLYYLLPVIDEVLAIRLSQNYYCYLQLKIQQALNPPTP
jgi:hypothetical protein